MKTTIRVRAAPRHPSAADAGAGGRK